jgi:hypothetical protein
VQAQDPAGDASRERLHTEAHTHAHRSTHTRTPPSSPCSLTSTRTLDWRPAVLSATRARRCVWVGPQRQPVLWGYHWRGLRGYCLLTDRSSWLPLIKKTFAG